MSSPPNVKEPTGIASCYDYRLLKHYAMCEYIRNPDKPDNTFKNLKPGIAYRFCPECAFETNHKLSAAYPWDENLTILRCVNHEWYDNDDDSDDDSNARNEIKKHHEIENLIFQALTIILPHRFTNTKNDEQIKKKCDSDLGGYSDTFKTFVPKKPSVKLIIGNVGAGKSTFTQHLKNMNRFVVAEDVNKWNSPLINHPLNKSIDNVDDDIKFQWFLIADALSKADYPIQESGIVGVLAHIIAKTLDGRYTYQQFLEFAVALSSINWANFEIILVNTPVEECLRRIHQRKKPYDQHFNMKKLKTLDNAIKILIPFFNYKIIDGENPFDHLIII